MTLRAVRDGQVITIHGDAGLSVKVEDDRQAGFTVSEPLESLRTFWAELGVSLQEAEGDES